MNCVQPRQEILVKECWGALAELFGLAASFFLVPPSLSFLARAQEAGVRLASWLPGEKFATLLAQSPTCLDEVAMAEQEYYDLFFVPFSGRYCPPFSSVYLNGRLDGGHDRKVRNCYEESGFSFHELGVPQYVAMLSRADFAGYELAFLAALAGGCAHDPEEDRFESIVATFTEFGGKHFGSWGEAFGRRVAERADTPCFQGAGELVGYLARLMGTMPLADGIGMRERSQGLGQQHSPTG